MNENTKIGGRQDGQALVEFVIILIFIMAMCAGMITMIRLLGFQFWAQQEARYIAWEQTWASHDFYSDPANEPIAKLGDSRFFGRPDIVSDRNSQKNVRDDQGLPELLSWLAPAATEKSKLDTLIGETSDEDAAVMLAKNTVPAEELNAQQLNAEKPWWKGKSSEWFAPGGSIDRAFSAVSTAYASVERTIRSEKTELDPQDALPEVEERVGNYRDRLEPKIRNFLIQADVGPKVCDGLRTFSRRNGDPAELFAFRQPDCSAKVEEGLAHEIAYGIDIKDFFRGYEQFMQGGLTSGGALEVSVREEVASGFYSFFDTLVSGARALAIPELTAGKISAGASLVDGSVTRMLGDARYIGSSIAIGIILAQGASITAQSPASQDANAELNFENSVNGMLQTDAADVIPGLGDLPFFLGPQYLPVPPTFGAVAPGLQNAIMKNLLSQSEDDELRDTEIENSNKLVEVTYDAAGGLVKLGSDRIRGAEAARLTGRYYLVTQPWHLKRRQDGTGAYRQKGTQTDTAGDETEEAVMRRRVLGLWLFPSDPAALLEPVSLIPGLGALAPVFQAFEPLGDFISIVKRFVTDNPLFDIAQALSEIPVIGDLIPVPPVWPAVRPDAYPGSVEMTGNDPDDPDKLMNEVRNFSDYVTEQRNNNPEPEPDYN